MGEDGEKNRNGAAVSEANWVGVEISISSRIEKERNGGLDSERMGLW